MKHPNPSTALVEGGDLHHYLQRHPDPWPEPGARREIIRLLRAVELLHSTSAVHRNITPRNGLVTADRVLKLGDFGIALHSVGEKDVRADAFTPGGRPTMSIGSDAWMSHCCAARRNPK